MDIERVEAEIRETKDFLSEVEFKISGKPMTKYQERESQYYTSRGYIGYIKRDTAEVLLFPSMVFMGIVGGLYGVAGLIMHPLQFLDTGESHCGFCAYWWLHPIAIVMGIGYNLVVSFTIYDVDYHVDYHVDHHADYGSF